LQLGQHRFESAVGLALEVGQRLSAPETAGHEHPFAALLGPERLQPGQAPMVKRITAQPQGLLRGVRLSELPEQMGCGCSVEVLPERIDGQLDVNAPTGVLTDQTDTGHGNVAAGLDQQPAMPLALIEQVFNPAIKNLSQLGRTGDLLEVPQQWCRLSSKWLELQLTRRGTRATAGVMTAGGLIFGLPAPDLVLAQGLKTLLAQHA
jgi:hypothetical protein